MNNKIYIQDFNDSGNLNGFPEMVEIGTKEEGDVISMFQVKDKLYALNQSALYELQTDNHSAEENKKQQSLNVVQKLVIQKGPDSDFVAKTLLTAKSVFQRGNFKKEIREEIFSLCIDTLFEFSSLIDAIENYNTCEEKELKKFNHNH